MLPVPPCCLKKLLCAASLCCLWKSDVDPDCTWNRGVCIAAQSGYVVHYLHQLLVLQLEPLEYPKCDNPPGHVTPGGADCNFNLTEDLKICPLPAAGA